MPTYRVQFTEVVSYDVTFKTDTPIKLDEEGYPEAEVDWFDVMDTACPLWYKTYTTAIHDRELDRPVDVIEAADK